MVGAKERTGLLGAKTIGKAGGVRIRQVVIRVSPSVGTPPLGDEGGRDERSVLNNDPDLPTPC